MMSGMREVVGSITIYQSFAEKHANWGAQMVVRVWSDKGRADYREYLAHGDTPESALVVLKDAVAKGEEGWTW